MDFSEITRTRRTVHNYTDRKVDDDRVREALELSLWAPNHKLTFPWRYVEVGPIARARLADLSVDLKSAKGELSDVKRAALRANVLTPSHLILLALKRHPKPETAYEDYATLACAVQIATTALWAKGVCTKWSTGGWNRHERTYEIMDLDPVDVKLEGALMIGYPAVLPLPPERPGLEQVFLRRA